MRFITNHCILKVSTFIDCVNLMNVSVKETDVQSQIKKKREKVDSGR